MKLYNTIINVINKVFNKSTDEVKPLERKVKTFDFDFTPMIKAAAAKDKSQEHNIKTFDFDFTPMIKAAMAKNNG